MSDPHRRHGLQPTRLLCPWDFPGKSTGVGGLPLPSLYSWAEFKRIQFFVGVSAFSQIKEFRKKFHLLIFKCSQGTLQASDLEGGLQIEEGLTTWERGI